MKYKKGMMVRIIGSIDEAGYDWNTKEVDMEVFVGRVGKITSTGKHKGIPVHIIDGNKYGVNFTDNMLEPLLTLPFYVDCPTEEVWNDVLKKATKMGFLTKPFEWRYRCKDGTPVFYFEADKHLEHCHDGYKNNFGYKHIPHGEFLEDETKISIKKLDKLDKVYSDMKTLEKLINSLIKI